METEEKWGLVKMSSTFAIDINVRFYDFLQKKAFLPSLPAAVPRCLYGWHSRQTIDISVLYFPYLDLYFILYFGCPGKR